MITRRHVLLAAAGAALPLRVFAQPAAKQYRIGMLETTDQEENRTNFKALRDALGERGYFEAKNLAFEYRSPGGQIDRFPELARELVQMKVDVIVTRGTPAVIAARNATETIPIVMASSGDPLGTRVVASLAQPGGNVTGLSALVAQLNPKRIEILRELVPTLKRIGFVANGVNPAQLTEWEEGKATAPLLGLELTLIDVRRPEQVRAQIEASIAAGGQGLVVGIDTVTQTHAAVIAEIAARQRIPAIYAAREFVDQGGLVSYGVDYAYLYRRTASYIDKLLKGAKPADLPVEQPVQFEMVVNLKAAKTLGLTVPQTLLARADDILE
jgi:putative ABC transport system substrate-binding protein